MTAPAKLSIWLFLLLAGIYVTVTRGHFWSTDEIAVYQQTRSLWEHGDLDTTPTLNTLPGHIRRYYAVYGPGQSVLALPLYGIGKAVRVGLEYMGAQTSIRVLAGPTIGGIQDQLWGGQVEIFFVNLFNALTVALLATVYFLFSLRLGASPKWALAATLIFALATHIAGFSTGFFQHGAESLFVLWSLYFLFCDSAAPSRRTRTAAGAAAGAMLLVRISTAVLLPALTAYLAYYSWRRLQDGNRRHRLIELGRQCIPFFLPVALAMLATVAVNYWKFGAFSLIGAYSRTVPFSTPLLLGLYGNLFSVGQSIFLFSPILFLAPWYFRSFARRHPAETAAILAMSVSSLLLYSKIYLWHGQWSFGPRYLVHLVPLLLLPLGPWLQEARKAAWLAIVPMVLGGLLIEVLHVAVNVSYVYYHEHYSSAPPFDYLFVPNLSQLAAHWRALLAWDSRVDTWLVNVARQFGTQPTVPVAICILWFLTWCGRQVRRYLREAETESAGGVAPAFISAAPVARGAAALVVVFTVAGLMLDHL
jgi:hypothetical protein